MSDNENQISLLRRNKKRLLRKEIINSFIFIKVFKTLFLINLIIFGIRLYSLYTILNKGVLLRRHLVLVVLEGMYWVIICLIGNSISLYLLLFASPYTV